MKILHTNPDQSALNEAPSVAAIEQWLIKKFADQSFMSPDQVNTSMQVTTLGLDSMDAVMIAGDLEEWLNIEVPSTLLWDYPTIKQIAAFLYLEVNNASAEQYRKAG